MVAKMSEQEKVAAEDMNSSYAKTSPGQDALPVVLFVDDEPQVLKAITRFSRGKPWRALTADHPEKVLAMLDDNPVDIVVSDMKMPNMNGDVLLTKIRSEHPDVLRILLTGHADIQNLENAINNAGIYNYISKPWDDHLLAEVIKGGLRLQKSERERKRLEELTKKQNRQLGRLALSLDKTVKERTIEIEQALTLLQMEHGRSRGAMNSALDVVTHLLEWSEGRANNHCSFVSEYAVKVAKALELSDEECDLAKLAGSLHDVGLMALPENIRSKPVYDMADNELENYQQHTILGEMALSATPELERVAKIVKNHHERLDGTGFPDALYAKDIDKITRIISVVADYHDLYHGMLEAKCLGHMDAKDYLQKQRGFAYDAAIVDNFLDIIGDNHVEKIHRFRVPVLQLKSGMVLEEDLQASNRLLLLTKGTIITENIIDRMIKYEEKFQCKFEPMVSEK